MNKRQKTMLKEATIIVVITAVAVFAMINFKDYINRSEVIKSLNNLSSVVKKHKETYGSVPSESYIEQIQDQLQGALRLGGLQYRSRWIDFDSPENTILAYTEKTYKSPFVGSGYVVLMLNGQVEWMSKKEFNEIFATQKKPQELELLRKE